MNAEQIEHITQRLQNGGYGWISRAECQKIIMLVEKELVCGSVPAALKESGPVGAFLSDSHATKAVA